MTGSTTLLKLSGKQQLGVLRPFLYLFVLPWCIRSWMNCKICTELSEILGVTYCPQKLARRKSLLVFCVLCNCEQTVLLKKKKVFTFLLLEKKIKLQPYLWQLHWLVCFFIVFGLHPSICFYPTASQVSDHRCELGLRVTATWLLTIFSLFGRLQHVQMCGVPSLLHCCNLMSTGCAGPDALVCI